MTSCCTHGQCKTKANHGAADLLIIGGGSAAFSAATRAAERGADKVIIINDGLPTGGTCVNVGCVPSKTLLRAAETLHRANHNPFAGMQTSGRLVDFAGVIAAKRALVTDLRQAKYFDVIGNLPQVQLIHGHGQLVDAHTVAVGQQRLAARHILIATGASAAIPDIAGLADTDYLTNESAFELEQLPESLLVLGGRYIALECAQMLARLGSRVTVLQRSQRILPSETPDLTDALTHYLQEEGLEIVTGVAVKQVRRATAGVSVIAKVGGAERAFSAAKLLVATGRNPNTAGLGLEEIGVKLDQRGFIQVGPMLQTEVADVWAAGDVLGQNMFVYTAAYEGALAATNALSGQPQARDYTALPWVIFTDPQVAGVGLDENQARAAGHDAQIAVLPLSYVPRAIAARDTRGFVKLIRDANTDLLLGARILAPEGGELLMEVVLAIKYGITVEELKECFHPYLTLGEAIKLAAITFGKDVSKLSCCAS